MKIIFALIALCAFACAFFSDESRADEKALTTELDQLASKKSLVDLIARVNGPRNAEELKVFLGWLQQKSLSDFGGARIHYLYSYGLYRTGILETASFVYLYAMLTVRLDAARCADRSAPTDKIFRWEQNSTPIFQNVSSLPLSERKRLLDIVLKVELAHVTRQPDEWLCNGGLVFMQKYFEKYKNSPNPPSREIYDPSRIGQTIVLEDDSIKPEFVSDNIWHIERAKIIEKFSEQVLAPRP